MMILVRYIGFPSFSLFFTILFGLSGIVFVSIYNDEIYYKLNALLSLSVLFYSLLIVPNAILLKRKILKLLIYLKLSLL